MGLSVHKSLRAGPFRFNLSSRGLGISAGVPGFRVGTGPRGNYVRVGAHGISYRATLGNSPSSRRGRPPLTSSGTQSAPTPPTSAPVPLEDVTGAAIHELVPTAPGDLVEQLNTAAAKQPLAPWVALAAVIAAVALGIVGLIILLAAIPLIVWLGLRDRGRRTVVAFYEVQDAPAAWYEHLSKSISNLARAQRVWRIVASGRVNTTYQHKTNAGASSMVSRRTVKVSLTSPPRLVTNVAVPTIADGRASLHFLPDRLLVREGRRFSDVSYEILRTTAFEKRFIEDGSVPSESQRVGATWQYVNVKGGPDRRYKNNRQLPIMLYGDLHITSTTGLDWHLNTSLLPAALEVSRSLTARPRDGLAPSTSPSTTTSPRPLPSDIPPSLALDTPSRGPVPTAPDQASASPPATPRIAASHPRTAPNRLVTPSSGMTQVVLNGDGRVEVVGESYYQPALKSAAYGGSAHTLGEAIRVQATLVPEPENPYDAHAVRVDVDGQPVGHLSRSIAPQYQPVLLDLHRRGHLGTCSGRIMGGGGRQYGIHLHLGSPSLLVPVNQADGLNLWDAVRHVTVTGEELHQDVLRALEPQSGPAAIFPIITGLDVCEIAKGKYAGEQTVEVQVNGRRVGQLTKAQANKYLPLVEADLARDQRPGCHAYVSRTADKGLQVTVLLPDVAS